MTAGKGLLSSIRNLRTFSSLGNPIYRLYFIGMLGQWAAMNMQFMSKSLLIYRITGSATLLGLLSLANALPMLFLSLFGGVIADRVQKKYVLLVGLGSSALVSLVIAISLSVGYLSSDHSGSWWVLIATSFLQGVIMGLMFPSRQAIIPEIVREEQVMNAVALNTMGMNSLRLLAPALSGFLIDAFDFEALYYAITALYLMSTIVIALMPLTSTMSLAGGRALANIKDGLQYMRHQPAILPVLAFTFVIILLSQPYQTLMPIFTEDILKVGAKGMGILLSVSGIGATAGSLVLASLPNRKRGALLLASGLILSLALVAFAFSTSWYLSLGLIFFVGIGQAGRMTMNNALLQSYTSSEYLGRVMSINMMDFGLSSFSNFFAALLAEAAGAPLAIGGFAVVLVLASILTMAFVPRLRQLQ